MKRALIIEGPALPGPGLLAKKIYETGSAILANPLFIIIGLDVKPALQRSLQELPLGSISIRINSSAMASPFRQQQESPEAVRDFIGVHYKTTKPTSENMSPQIKYS